MSILAFLRRPAFRAASRRNVDFSKPATNSGVPQWPVPVNVGWTKISFLDRVA